MIRILFCVIFCLSFNTMVNAQCSDRYIENRKYPGICVENLVQWLHQSRSNWENQMETYDFSKKYYDKGDLTFSTSNKHSDIGIQLMFQKPFGFITIINAPLFNKKNGFFSYLIDEIEPFYAGKKAGMNIFQFKFSDGKNYEIGVSENKDYDMVILREL